MIDQSDCFGAEKPFFTYESPEDIDRHHYPASEKHGDESCQKSQAGDHDPNHVEHEHGSAQISQRSESVIHILRPVEVAQTDIARQLALQDGRRVKGKHGGGIATFGDILLVDFGIGVIGSIDALAVGQNMGRVKVVYPEGLRKVAGGIVEDAGDLVLNARGKMIEEL